MWIRQESRKRSGAAVGGGGLDSAVSGGVSVNQRRGVDRNARQVGGSTSEDWSCRHWSEWWLDEDSWRGQCRLSTGDPLCAKVYCSLGMCEDRQVGVDASEVSNVLWDSWRPVAEVEGGLRAVFAKRR